MRFNCRRLLKFGLFAAGVSFLLAAIQGIIGGYFSESMEPDPMAIGVEAAFALEEALWLDARSRSVYEQSHLAGALLLNEDDWEEGIESLLEVWNPERSLVVYCDGGGCAASRHVALRLREEFGMEAVFWLIDGWDALKAAGKVGQ